MVLNPKYKPSKKNGYNPPPCDDERKKWIPVACGNCIECRKKKQREWRARMLEEIKHDKSGKFVTLTFSEEALNELEIEKGTKEANAIAIFAIRRFLERWRKKFKVSVKHWFITELGHSNTERLHLHGVLFTKEDKETIESIWKYGRIDVGYNMGERCINYVMKYVTKVDSDHPGFIGRILTSKGIGKGYINTYNASQNKYVPNKTNETYRLNNGDMIALPQYYRRKIYSDEERENLWVEKLDKEELYVMGNKLKIDNDENRKIYENAVRYARKISKERGYGAGEKKKMYLTRNNILNIDDEKISAIFAENKEKRTKRLLQIKNKKL